MTAAFLVAAASFVTRLGGKRRRGMGKCRIALQFDGYELPDGPEGADLLAKAAAILERDEHRAPPQLQSETVPIDIGKTGPSAVGAWTKLALRLKLREPVIIADAVLGNVVTTLDFIPGSMILPYVVRAFKRAGVPRQQIAQMIASADLHILPAYPEISGRRGLPVPLSWRQPKLGGALTSSFEASTDKQQQKPMREGYVDPTAQKFKTVHKPEKTIRTHNTVEDKHQTPTETVGGVYSYEALASDQCFRCEVWFRGIAMDGLAEQLKGRAHIGRARKAGYGAVNVEVIGGPEEVPTASPPDGIIYLLLESDVLLRGHDLAAKTDLELLLAHIEARLGSAEGALFDRGDTRAEIRTRRLESWQAGWGLPRPSLISRPSCSIPARKCKKSFTAWPCAPFCTLPCAPTSGRWRILVLRRWRRR